MPPDADPETAAPTIGFIGAGRVATVLGRALAERGYTVTAIASRSVDAARRLAAALPAAVAQAAPQDVVNQASLVFLAVPDDAIAGVAASLVWRPGQTVCHCSGALDITVLEPAAQAGARVGSFHPLQTFADSTVQPLDLLRGITIAIEGTDATASILEHLARVLGAEPLRLLPADKALYHASAVLAAGCVVALFSQACQVWETFGRSPARAQSALLPLLHGVVQALDHLPPEQALSGPVARGDLGTIQRHLTALAEQAPEILPTYRALNLQAVSLARARGAVSLSRAEQLRAALAGLSAPTNQPQATLREEESCA